MCEEYNAQSLTDELIILPAALKAAGGGNTLAACAGCQTAGECEVGCQGSSTCEYNCQSGECGYSCQSSCQTACELSLQGCSSSQSTPSVSLWSWTASNGSASAAQTSQFYKVLNGQAPPESGFSHLVWNDLVNKVSEVREAYGYSTWHNYGGLSKSNCLVSSGSTLSASVYNAVRYNVGSMTVATGITDRSANQEILGHYITRLTDVLNEVIDGG